MLLSKIFIFYWTMVLAGLAVASPARSRPRPRPITNKPVNSRPGTGGPRPRPVVPLPVTIPVTIPTTIPTTIPATAPANTSEAIIAARAKGTLAVLGYRTVSKEQALLYNKRGRLSGGFNALLMTGSKQIGNGVYTSPAPGEWLGMKGEENWFCVIVGDKDALDKHPKVWIPESNGKVKLHWRNDVNDMQKWAEKTFPKKFDFWTAFRLSKITGAKVGTDVNHHEQLKHPDSMQLLIPTDVIIDKKMEKALGLQVQCEADWHNLPVKEPINYDTAWPKKSIYGKSQWVDQAQYGGASSSSGGATSSGGSKGSGCWGFKCLRL